MLALQLFKQSQKYSLKKDVISFNATISACEKAGKWQNALVLLEAADFLADVITYNASISACEKAGKWQLAIHVLQQMKNITVEADLISYNSAISACREDAWPYALHLMADVISYSSAVCACETACEWQSAWLLLQTVRQKRLINVIALNSFLSTLARAGQWELALWLIYRERPVKLDVISYSSGINACQKSSSWQHGLFLLQDANGRQLHLNVVSYSAALSTSGPSAWHMVLGLLRRSGNFRLQLNEDTVVSLSDEMNSCRKELQEAFELKLSAQRQETAERLSHDLKDHVAELEKDWQARFILNDDRHWKHMNQIQSPKFQLQLLPSVSSFVRILKGN
eukprot:g2303.t1